MGEQADMIVDHLDSLGTDEVVDDHDYPLDYMAMGDCTHCGHVAQVHPDNPRVTRALKAKAHKAFDRIWQSGRMRRGQAYRWLARELDVRPEQAHMAAMDRHEVLERVIEASDRYMGTPLAAADFPDDDDDEEN